MKLRADLSLDDKRAAALAKIDADFVSMLTPREVMARLYAEKEAIAANVLRGRAEPPEWLLLEAASKATPVHDLCQSIVDKATQARADLIALESVRQRAKAQARLATSEQAITRAATMVVA